MIEAILKLRITEVERGDVAYEQLVDENQFNEPAPEGNEWIIVNFEIEMLDGDEDVPYTRVVEHKHFTPWENHNKTVYVKEYSKETGPGDIPYYPKRLDADKQILSRYRSMAESLDGISFLGRLATYRYMDMHNVIGEALEFSNRFIQAIQSSQKPPVFSNTEI